MQSFSLLADKHCPTADKHVQQDLYQAAAFLRMHQLTKKLREHCLVGSSADASYEKSERMLACLIAECSRRTIEGKEELLPSAVRAYITMTRWIHGTVSSR